MMAAEGQRERRADRRLKKSIARLRKALEKELAELEAEIDDQVRGPPVWAGKENLLASVPGVGPIIARTLIAEMPELGTLDRRQIAALAGPAPWTRQSGQWKGKSFIGGGRNTVRSLLFWARSPHPGTTPSSKTSATNSSPPKSQRWSQPSPSLESC
jgi:transposase